MVRRQSHNPKIPIIICIDIEPDELAIKPYKRKDWRGFRATWKYFKRLRPLLELATKSAARFNWFLRMDPQVAHTYGSADWAAIRYPKLFAEMQHAQDEIGLHLHVWRWDDVEQKWVSDFADQEWIEHCVRQSFYEFERCFKRPCRSFRFGDRWMNNRTVELIECLGARFDLTIEPGRKPEKLPYPFTGSLPDYTTALRRHYRPSKSDYLQPGDAHSQRDLWIIPLSTANINWASPLLSPESRLRLTLSVSAAYEGYFDYVDQDWIVGWVYDATRSDETVYIDVYDNGEIVGSYAADLFRPDLLSAGKGNGAHGFQIPAPESKKDGRLHEIRIKVAGADFELNHSPKEVSWDSRAVGQDFWTMNLFNNSALFCKFFDSLIYEQKTPLLTFVIRSDAVLYRDARGHIERNIEHIISHPLAESFVITTPAEVMQIIGSEEAQ